MSSEVAAPASAPYDHARQHEDEGAVSRLDRGGDESDERNGAEPAREAQQLDRRDRQREENPEHRAEARPGGHAENVGRDERVAEDRLVARARRRQRRADQQRGGHPRKPDRQQHGFGRAGAFASRQHRQRLDEPERIGPDQERGEAAEDQRAGKPERRPGPRFPALGDGVQGARPFAHSRSRSRSASPRSTWYQSL